MIASRAKPTPPLIESTSQWSSSLTIHRPDGPHAVRFSVAHHRRERLGAEMLFVAVESDQLPTPQPDAPHVPKVDGPLLGLLDREARVLALEAGWEPIWRGPEAIIGTLISMMIHPDDLAELVPLVDPL